MGWSLKLGKWFGIDVNLHLTFLLLIGFLVISGLAVGRDPGMVVANVGLLLVLFLCVLLHELGHALAAKHYGIATKDITLLPIGGVARLERMPDNPKEELVVALAGPLVNVLIALALLPIAALSASAFVESLLSANLLLVLFNLIPAFPMDGGRVLRAVLALKMNYTRATRTAATIGQGFAVLFGIVGLFSNPFLLFIAIFIWFAAAGEASMTQTKSQLSGVPVERAMKTQFETLSPINSLRYAAQLVLGGLQQVFPVVEAGRVVGLVTRHDLLHALSERGSLGFVSQAMRRDFATIEAGEMLATAVERLQGGEVRALVVLRQGQMAGLLTLENVQEFVMVQAALDKTVGGDKREAPHEVYHV